MSRNGKTWLKPAVLAAVVVTAGGLGVAAAGPWGLGHGHDGGRCEYRGGGRMDHKSGELGPGRHIEGKLAFLKTELGITGGQEQAWEEFAGVVRESAGKRAGMWQSRREERRQSREERPSLNERLEAGSRAWSSSWLRSGPRRRPPRSSMAS